MLIFVWMDYSVEPAKLWRIEEKLLNMQFVKLSYNNMT